MGGVVVFKDEVMIGVVVSIPAAPWQVLPPLLTFICASSPLRKSSTGRCSVCLKKWRASMKSRCSLLLSHWFHRLSCTSSRDEGISKSAWIMNRKPYDLKGRKANTGIFAGSCPLAPSLAENPRFNGNAMAISVDWISTPDLASSDTSLTSTRRLISTHFSDLLLCLMRTMLSLKSCRLIDRVSPLTWCGAGFNHISFNAVQTSILETLQKNNNQIIKLKMSFDLPRRDRTPNN